MRESGSMTIRFAALQSMAEFVREFDPAAYRT